MSSNDNATHDQARRLAQDPERCYRARIAAGLTQVQLAKKAGVTDATICRMEQGAVSVLPETLGRVARALDRPVEDLMPAPVEVVG